MWASRYFNPRYWAGRYFPKIGGTLDPSQRVSGDISVFSSYSASVLTKSSITGELSVINAISET